MTDKEILYRSMIDELDRKNAERLSSQTIQNWNRREVYDQVSKRMVEQKAYQD